MIKKPDGTILDVESLKSAKSLQSTESSFDSGPASLKDEELAWPTVPRRSSASQPNPEGVFVKTKSGREVWVPVPEDTSATPASPWSPPHTSYGQGEETEELSRGTGDGNSGEEGKEGEESDFGIDPSRETEGERVLRIRIQQKRERIAKRHVSEPESIEVSHMFGGSPGPSGQVLQEEEEGHDTERQRRRVEENLAEVRKIQAQNREAEAANDRNRKLADEIFSGKGKAPGAGGRGFNFDEYTDIDSLPMGSTWDNISFLKDLPTEPEVKPETGSRDSIGKASKKTGGDGGVGGSESDEVPVYRY